MRIVVVLVMTAALGMLHAGCSSPRDASKTTSDADRADDAMPREVIDLEGKTLPLYDDATQGLLLVFTSHNCPIANAYAPRIQRINDQFATRGIRCILVHVDPRASVEQLQTHAHEFDLHMPILHDRAHEWVRRAGATVTPQAVLFDRQGQMVYSGRIDDQYVDFGAKRRAASQHDLVDALEAYLAGEPIVRAQTQPVGCYIADLSPETLFDSPGVETSR